MIRYIAMSLSLIMILTIVGCGTKSNGNGSLINSSTDMSNKSEVVDTDKTQDTIYKIDTPVDMEKLKEKYPEFFEIEGEPFKGIEVYVWQMAEDLYFCGLMFGTNRNKTDEELLSLQEKALSIDEAKALLNEIGVSKDSILIYPISQPYSSYMYNIDEEYKNNVYKLFE